MGEVINEKIAWLEENQDASAEYMGAQKKEMEDIVQPIIAKLYQGAGGPPPEGGRKRRMTSSRMSCSCDKNCEAFPPSDLRVIFITGHHVRGWGPGPWDSYRLVSDLNKTVIYK